MGIFDDLADLTGAIAGATLGIATYPIAVVLGVSERLVKQAVRAEYKTQREIKEWIEDNS